MQNESIDPQHHLGVELRQAASLGDIDKIQTLLAAGVDVGVLHNSPVRWAVRHRQTAAVGLLLQSGASLDSYETVEVLERAAGHGDSGTLNVLLAKLPGATQQGLIDRALGKAAGSKDLATVQLLLNQGADPNANGFQAMKNAASGGCVELMSLLVQHGGDVRGDDSAVVDAATRGGQPRMLEYVLAAGANVHGGWGAAAWSALANGEAEILEILLRAESPFSPPLALEFLGGTDCFEALLILREYGVDWAAQADELAKRAAHQGRARMLEFILNNARVNAQVLSESLEPATEGGFERVVELLIAHGADPTTKQSAAFVGAIRSKEFGIARRLLKAGARVADLPDFAFRRVYAAGDVPLAIELLQGGVAVKGSDIEPGEAWDLTEKMGPDALMLDAQGQLHAGPIGEARFVLCHALMENAKDYLNADRENRPNFETERARLCQWFAGALIRWPRPYKAYKRYQA